jgi:hypothetical protein
MSAPAKAPAAAHVTLQALGEDRWRLRCRRPRCPADVQKITSPGGARQFAVLHRAKDPAGLVAAALAEVGR